MKKAIDYIKISYEERYKFQQYEMSVLKETHHDTIVKAINTARIDVLDEAYKRYVQNNSKPLSEIITELKKEIE